MSRRWIVLMGVACVIGVSACDHIKSKGTATGEVKDTSQTKTAPDQVMPQGGRYGGGAENAAANAAPGANQ